MSISFTRVSFFSACFCFSDSLCRRTGTVCLKPSHTSTSIWSILNKTQSLRPLVSKSPKKPSPEVQRSEQLPSLFSSSPPLLEASLHEWRRREKKKIRRANAGLSLASSPFSCANTRMDLAVILYIYIYICRERYRYRERYVGYTLYIYIYISIHVCLLHRK